MRSAKCTIRKVHNKFIDMLKIDCFARKNQFTAALLCFAWKHLVVLQNIHNNRIFLQKINISDQTRFKTAQYCRFVSKFCTGLSVHGDAEQEVVSYPFPQALPFVCAGCRVCAALPSVHIVQSASLHSFKLVFLVSART